MHGMPSRVSAAASTKALHPKETYLHERAGTGHLRKDWRTKLRNAVWPRMGLRRYSRYLRMRVLRLSASPHAIGAGVAAGAAVSVFPLIGLHFVLRFILAFQTRGNMIAAAIGTAFGNPLTFPLFFS